MRWAPTSNGLHAPVWGMVLVGLMFSASCRPQAKKNAAPSNGVKPVQNEFGQSTISLSKTQKPETSVSRIAARIDSKDDDWESEQLAGKVQTKLEDLAKLVESNQLSDLQLAEIMSPDVECQFHREETDELYFADSTIQVHLANSNSLFASLGFSGFRRLVSNWKAAPPVDSPLKLKFKLFQIEPTDAGCASRAYLEVSKTGSPSSTQFNLECQCVWKTIDQAVELLEFDVTKAARAQISVPNGKLLVDCTRTLMDSEPVYRQQVVPGIPYWARRIGRELMGQFGHHGLVVGDVNGDGLEDIYVCDTGGLPNRLYLQQVDGTLKDASKNSGIDLLEESLGALLIDLDNDGDQDLVVASDPFVHFAENDGAGHFSLRSPVLIETDAYSLCAADFDNDRDLDVYVCGYNARRQDAVHRGLPFPLPYHDANNGGRNYLLRNDGDFTFSDATIDVGLDIDNRRFSLAAAWEDYDNDGDLDLYVANDFGRNCLYNNRNGSFVNVAAAAGVEDQASGMSVSWGDYDNDGHVDLYVSNMFSAAGNRVTFQRRFAGGISDETLSNVQRMARGNTLFRNRGDGTFEDTSVTADVVQGRWAWGSRFVDLNNDGWQDVVVANGYVTNDDTSDL